MSSKVALLLAAGLVGAACVVSFSPARPSRADSRLEQFEADATVCNRRLNELTVATHDRLAEDRDAIAAAVTRLDRLDAAVRAIEKRPTPPPAVVREVAPPPRPFVPSNSVAVLPFQHVPQPGENRPNVGYHPLAAALTTALVSQPGVRVRSLALLGESKGAASDPLAAGRTLGVRYVVSVTSMRHYRSSGANEYALHTELIEIGSGTTVWAEDVKFPWFEQTVEPGDPVGKALADLAKKIGERVGEK